ncbi:MAG: PsiF family protein [Alphaproteobacteria bacterium]
MKKTVLCLVALIAFCGEGYAQTAPNVPPAKSQTAQQSRMSNCAKEYHAKNIPKSQYHAFMKECLSSKPMGTGAGTGAGSKGAPKLPAPAQQ